MVEHSILNSTFPVLLPNLPIRLDKLEFDNYITELVHPEVKQDATAVVSEMPIRGRPCSEPSRKIASPGPFMKALLKFQDISRKQKEETMLTANNDIAFSTSGEPLIDLFFELEHVISGARLEQVLSRAWDVDPDVTLRIIWNSRSIHMGKGSREVFYRAAGWLTKYHPQTLLTNLPFLVRPVIPKKVKSAEYKEAEKTSAVEDQDFGDFKLIEAEDEREDTPRAKRARIDVEDDQELSQFDVKYGLSHAYWKDLLNILALAVHAELRVDGDPRSVFNVQAPKRHKRDFTPGQKTDQIRERHGLVVLAIREDSFYKALHLTVARIFAEQLRLDLARLNSGDKAEMKKISQAAKWAPSNKGMHDQHCCIVSTIAELLYPAEDLDFKCTATNRREYILHTREAYQRLTLSPLRKHLDVVERKITTEDFDKIDYQRVPSLAMQQYTKLFAKKDPAFDDYLTKVAEGKADISGAVLLPSTIVSKVRPKAPKSTKAPLNKKIRELEMKSANAQWQTLCQRIRDSGKLESSIAICDVSGSMLSPVFHDGSTPMHSSIGLSLLLAEVGSGAFGGAFITFSGEPRVVRVGGPDDKRTLEQKVDFISNADWGFNTDFVAVFEKLLLPMAVENKLSKEDMVKNVYVFSDMQFDSADAGSHAGWGGSMTRVKEAYEQAGYDLPRLIFWNLAGGRGGGIAPKPAQNQEGVALVSGYSQGLLKTFLDEGVIETPEKEEIEVEEVGDDVVVSKAKKAKQNSLDVVLKAISHEAYRMLRVVD